MDDGEFEALRERAGSLDMLVTVALRAGLDGFERRPGDRNTWRSTRLREALGDPTLRERVRRILDAFDGVDIPPQTTGAGATVGVDAAGVRTATGGPTGAPSAATPVAVAGPADPLDEFLAKAEGGRDAVPATAWRGFSFGERQRRMFDLAESVEPPAPHVLVAKLRELAWPVDPPPEKRLHPLLRRAAKTEAWAPFMRAFNHVMSAVEVACIAFAADAALDGVDDPRGLRSQVRSIGHLALGSIRGRMVHEAVGGLAATARSQPQDLLAVKEAAALELQQAPAGFWGSSKTGDSSDPDVWAAHKFGLPPAEAWRSASSRGGRSARGRPATKRGRPQGGTSQQGGRDSASPPSAARSSPPPTESEEKPPARKAPRGRGGGGGRGK